VKFYPDTSFLCALYRNQDNTANAVGFRASVGTALPVTALVLFEFRQSVRWQTYLHRKDSTKGYGYTEATRMLSRLEAELAAGLLQVSAVDLAAVVTRAEVLSARGTGGGGYRAFDILHVATALELGATDFVTFDARQGALAKAAGMKIKP